MLPLRPMKSYKEIHNKYWRYGFWYEKIAAILLWILNTLFYSLVILFWIILFIKIL